MRRRVTLAVKFYRDGMAPRLLLSGGGSHIISEAEVMRALARAAGVSEAHLLCESASRNTAENALYSARILREAGWHRVVLVSHRTHLFRARLVFRLAGIAVVGCLGVPSRSVAAALRSVVHEAVALPRSILRVLCRR